MRTRRFVIGLSVLLALAACSRPDTDPVETRHGTSLPTTIASPELSAIDSLMWRQPDSALARLIPYFDTCCRDAMIASPDDATDFQKRRMQCVSTAEFNRHYAHLLLAELLYKNDYSQTNRPALLQAVRYFDSLTFTLNDTPEPKRLIAGTDPLSLTRNDNLAFLVARAHYINGVGYYEHDSIVPACAEYLKALELMESHFDVKDLVGKKAKFMSYTNNHLGSLFSSQFMMESSIMCYKEALAFCLIAPTSAFGISNNCCRIGNQNDMIGEKDTAIYYYDKALENLPNTNNLTYRDIISSKALLSYQINKTARTSIEELKSMVGQASDENERYTRFLTIGDIYYEEGQFDSARYYLEIVFENKEDMVSKIRAAEYLRTIYDSVGDKEKSDLYVHYLANHKKPDSENKAFVSKLNELFKNYLDKKKEKNVAEERKATEQKLLRIVIPLSIVLALAIIVMAKLRGWKLLKKQQSEADRLLEEKERQHEKELRQRQEEAEKALEDKEKYHQQEMEAKEAKARKELEERDNRHAEAIEAERQAHRMEQAAISGRLKQKNEEVRELRDQIKRQEELEATPKHAESFVDEPICQLILERVKEGKFKSKVDYLDYKDSALSKQQLFDLRVATDRHFDMFTIRLKNAYPQLTNSDLDYCCLYLLGMTNADLAALMQRAYNTVVERDGKLKKIIGNDNPLPITLMGLANNSLSV